MSSVSSEGKRLLAKLLPCLHSVTTAPSVAFQPPWGESPVLGGRVNTPRCPMRGYRADENSQRHSSRLFPVRWEVATVTSRVGARRGLLTGKEPQ